MEPTRTLPFSMVSSWQNLAAPFWQHADRPDLASSTRYVGTGSSAADA